MFPVINSSKSLSKKGSFEELRVNSSSKFARDEKKHATNVLRNSDGGFERNKYSKNKTHIYVTETDDFAEFKHSKTHAGPLSIDIEDDPMENFKNEPWYRKEMKSFRSEKNNKVRTVVYTLEPKKKPAFDAAAIQLLKESSNKQSHFGAQLENKLHTPNIRVKTPRSNHEIEVENNTKKQKVASFVYLNNETTAEDVTVEPTSLKHIHSEHESNEGRTTSKEKDVQRENLESPGNITSQGPNTRFIRAKRKNLTMTNPDNPTFKREIRKRNFELKAFARANMFEGLPFIQFEGNVRKDPYMQKIIVRDILKVVQDKCNSLKINLVDKGRIQGIFPYISPTNQIEFNKLLEEIIALIHNICKILLQEFKDDIKKIGMNPSPLDYPENREAEFFYEKDILKSNIKIYKDIFDFMKDSFECYLIMSRQKDRIVIGEHEFMLFLKYVNKCRYDVGIMMEALRNHDKNITDRLQRLKEFKNLTSEKNKASMNISPILSSIMEPNDKPDINTMRASQRLLPKTERRGSMIIKEKESYGSSQNEEFVKKIQKLNKHLQKKFKLATNSQFTRESKVNLNQDRTEYEKALLLADESSIKHELSKKADNRVKVKLEKLKNPLLTPEIALALNIARKYHLIDGKEFVNFSETKEEE